MYYYCLFNTLSPCKALLYIDFRPLHFAPQEIISKKNKSNSNNHSAISKDHGIEIQNNLVLRSVLLFTCWASFFTYKRKIQIRLLLRITEALMHHVSEKGCAFKGFNLSNEQWSPCLCHNQLDISQFLRQPHLLTHQSCFRY